MRVSVKGAGAESTQAQASTLNCMSPPPLALDLLSTGSARPREAPLNTSAMNAANTNRMNSLLTAAFKRKTETRQNNVSTLNSGLSRTDRARRTSLTVLGWMCCGVSHD